MRKCWFVLFVIFLVPLFISGCGQEMEFSHYNMSLYYDAQEHQLCGKQSVSYVNNSDNAFENLYFHLYPNAFRMDASIRPVSLGYVSSAYPNGESFGSIEIKNVQDSGFDVNFEIVGEDMNILKVPLKEKLYPDEKVLIDMEYTVSLPNVHHRFGYGEDTINVANFYPIACVYEEGRGFVQDVYDSTGDPFYSDVSNYDVEINLPQNLVLASSGDVVKIKESDGRNVVSIRGQRIRDFAFVMSEKFEVETITSNQTEVRYYHYNDNNAKASIETCQKALEFFNEKFGQYPYKQLSVVQSDFVYGGMEYPNIVIISDELSEENKHYVIIHEIAHQWWYGVVGNDEYNEAWVDEALTEYSTTLFYENHEEYGLSYDTIVENANTSFKFFYDIYDKICGEVDTSMAKSLDHFATAPEYVHSVYTQGIIMYDSLRQLIGENKFYKCCQNYFEKQAYKNSSGAELVAIFSKASLRNLESFFSSYLNGNVLIA